MTSIASEFHVAEKVGSGWLWCLHCGRAYQHGEFRLIDGLQMCPYRDCGGDALLDAWPWDDYKSQCDWPDLPARGKIYELR